MPKSPNGEPAAEAATFTPPTFETETTEPAELAPRLSAAQAASQEFYNGLVTTAPRDKMTRYFTKTEADASAMAARLGRALTRKGLRDAFRVGTNTHTDGRFFAYLTPKKSRKAKGGNA